MTKKTTTVEELDAVLNPVQTDEDKAYDRTRQEQRDAEWLRIDALTRAIEFHKNNGGMLTAPQLVEHANVFLSFIKGETK
jgi:hypothetical protein